MAIHIPTPSSPIKWTNKSWAAYLELNKASMDFVTAYRDTIGLFATFSIKKNKKMKEKEQAYKLAEKKYYKIAFGGKS